MNLPHVLLPRPHTASRCRMNLPHVLLPRFSLGGASLALDQAWTPPAELALLQEAIAPVKKQPA